MRPLTKVLLTGTYGVYTRVTNHIGMFFFNAAGAGGSDERISRDGMSVLCVFT